MYVNPFWAGVFTTVFVEIVGIFAMAVYIAYFKKGGRR